MRTPFLLITLCSLLGIALCSDSIPYTATISVPEDEVLHLMAIGQAEITIPITTNHKDISCSLYFPGRQQTRKQLLTDSILSTERKTRDLKTALVLLFPDLFIHLFSSPSIGPDFLTLTKEQYETIKGLEESYQPIAVSIINYSAETILLPEKQYLGDLSPGIIDPLLLAKNYPAPGPLIKRSRAWQLRYLLAAGSLAAASGISFLLRSTRDNPSPHFIRTGVASGLGAAYLLFAAYVRETRRAQPLASLNAQLRNLMAAFDGPTLHDLDRNERVTPQVVDDHIVIPPRSIFSHLLVLERDALHYAPPIQSLTLSYMLAQPAN